MEENEGSPQLTTIVVITLPPKDNPSFGKTITAFTVPDDSQSLPQSHHQVEPPQPQGQGQFSVKKSLFFGSPIGVFGLLSISLIALFYLFSVSQETLFELREIDDDHESNTIIFPLYPKPGIWGNSKRDVELKLGRFVNSSSKIVMEITNDGMSQRKISKAMLSESTVDSTAILPVKGNIYPDGLYYTYLLVGNPRRPYFLDVDTGSDLTWIQCDAPCTSCAKGAHPFYKPKKSNLIDSKDSYCVDVQKSQGTKCETCHQCDYEIEYADHSSSLGVLARDKFHLMSSNGSFVNSNYVFGCAYDQQGLLLHSLAKTDGILGLSRGKISLPSQLTTNGNLKNVVALCFAADTSGGGYVFLGNDFVPHQQMTWVPMLNRPYINSYHTEVAKVSYGGKQLSLGDGGIRHVVFDSGSSYTYFTGRAYNDLVIKLQYISGEGFSQDSSDDTLPICWQAKFAIRSVAEIRQFFKPLVLQFGSKWWIVTTKLEIPPEGYLIISNKGNVCLGILDGSNVDDRSTIILGDISLRGQLFVYDNVNQKIGWIKSECKKPQRFEHLLLS